MPGLGQRLSFAVQSKALGYETVPIIEVFNRDDWPGKRDEFFKGNFGALSMAREAGYDLILVGYLDNTDRADNLAAFWKVVEVEGGITILSGRVEVSSYRDDLRGLAHWVGLDQRRPDILSLWPMYEELSSCIVKETFREDVASG